MSLSPAVSERTPEQLWQHYEVERELAERLRRAPPADRSRLYSVVYNELFQRVPLHPQLTRVSNQAEVERIIVEKLRVLSRFISPQKVFLELGAGDCRLTVAVAKHVKFAYALDVSDEVNQNLRPPSNFQLLLTRGTEIPLPDASVDLAYSYQLMEHIHPDDALEQLRNIHRVLAPGGLYICVTPNRLTGPHDISRFFTSEATGFHLKEYTLGELGQIFTDAGFYRVRALPGIKGHFVSIPITALRGLEAGIRLLPRSLRVASGTAPVLGNVLMSAVVAQKR